MNPEGAQLPLPPHIMYYLTTKPQHVVISKGKTRKLRPLFPLWAEPRSDRLDDSCSSLSFRYSRYTYGQLSSTGFRFHFYSLQRIDFDLQVGEHAINRTANRHKLNLTNIEEKYQKLLEKAEEMNKETDYLRVSKMYAKEYCHCFKCKWNFVAMNLPGIFPVCNKKPF